MRKWAAPDTRRGLAYFFALLGKFFLKQYRGILKTESAHRRQMQQ